VVPARRPSPAPTHQTLPRLTHVREAARRRGPSVLTIFPSHATKSPSHETDSNRLAALGVEPESAVSPAVGSGGRGAAWERGLRAARQYLAREGNLVVGRAVVETVTDDDGQEHPVKLDESFRCDQWS
jgi:hypothetical protein